MATSYSLIYERFTNKITDYGYAKLDSYTAELVFQRMLKSAIVKFNQCKNDLSDRDDMTEEFTDDLTELEQEILATYMVQEWIGQKLYASELMEKQLGTKDFSIFSPANHLKEIRETKASLQSDINDLLIAYSYNNDLSDLR